jgi:site-specific DNA-methyltransferase (adenine-specific)
MTDIREIEIPLLPANTLTRPMQAMDLRRGDCLEVMRTMATGSVDLIVTSPPYADQRKSTYGGVAPEDYVVWFMPIAAEMKRVLKPDGTLIINIKEKAVDGERHTYVLELILAMKKQGWLWTEEYIWHKKTSVPGKWSNRFRDGWERCLQFNKERAFNMYQEAVMVPVSASTTKRLKTLCANDHQRTDSNTGSGFGINRSRLVNRSMVYPDNVLQLSPETTNKNHSAAFPVDLPAWFIKLFSKDRDTVLDPFMGSGTTGVAARQYGRRFIGIEKNESYFSYASKRLAQRILF